VRLEVPTAAVFKKLFDLSRTNNSLWLRQAPPAGLLHFLVALPYWPQPRWILVLPLSGLKEPA
jgi:hypothetical protein